MRDAAMRGLWRSGELAADLVVAFELELADHAVEVAGESGKVAERFNGFFSTLRVLG